MSNPKRTYPGRKICHLVVLNGLGVPLAEEYSEQPSFCEKDDEHIVDCVCCPQCCTCGG